MAPRVNTARITRTGLKFSDVDFVWSEPGYRRMQRQASIIAYMQARATRLEEEMRQLTNGGQRTKADYRKNWDYSQSWPIGTSRNYALRDSIKSRFIEVGTRDFPYSFNVGPYRYKGPNNISGLGNIEMIRFGRDDNNQQGRDFIARAVRNSFGLKLG